MDYFTQNLNACILSQCIVCQAKLLIFIESCAIKVGVANSLGNICTIPADS